MEIDENTGLPALPAGYRWLVGDNSIGAPRISIQKKGWFFWNDVTSSFIDIDYYNWARSASQVTKEAISYSAKNLYIRWQKMGETSNLYGTYPPKSL